MRAIKIPQNDKHQPALYYSAYPYPLHGDKVSQKENDFYRELMDFKNGRPSQKLLDAFVNKVSKAVLATKSFNNTVVVFQPSSKVANTLARWSALADELRKVRINVEPEAIRRTQDVPDSKVGGKKDSSHTLENIEFNPSSFKGKNVILIDDIITTGESSRKFIDKLNEYGALKVNLVTVCATRPKMGHTDSKDRFFMYPAQSKLNDFSDNLNPKEHLTALFNMNMDERQLDLFQASQKKEFSYQETLRRGNSVSMVAEADNKITNNKPQINLNQMEQNKKDENKQEQPAMQLPKSQLVGFANVSTVKDKDGNVVKTPDPTFATTLKVENLLKAAATSSVSKGKNYEWIDLSVERNPKHGEGQSEFKIMQSKQDKDCVVNGQQMKYQDRKAVFELHIDRNSLMEKLKDMGVKSDGEISLKFNKQGITLNPEAHKLYSTDPQKLKVFGRTSIPNNMERVIKSEQNLHPDTVGSQNRYVDKYVGTAYGTQAKDKDNAPSVNKNNEPVMFYNAKLNVKEISEMPNSDQFGNVKIAIVRRDLSPEKLANQGLHMEEGSSFPKNANGISMPNYHVMADPKTYKNGEPNAHVEAVITVNKDELLNMPRTKESFTNKDGQKVENEFVHVTLNQYKTLSLNQKAYQALNVAAEPQRLTASAVHYSPAIVQQEMDKWKLDHPAPSQEEREANRQLPTQYETYKKAAESIEDSAMARQSKREEMQASQEVKPTQPVRKHSGPSL